MNELQAIKVRHSVRKYIDTPITPDVRAELDAYVALVNLERGLNILVRYDDPEGFDSRLAHYGSFRNVSNYIVLKGKKTPDFDERCGYYGEKIAIKAQMLGLNTCWAAMTFNKKMVKTLIPAEEAFCMVIALGYGETQGNSHKCKSYEDVVVTMGNAPKWFTKGVEAALLAPTAVNQQQFVIGMKNGKPVVKVAGRGFYVNVDLGIVKYHFEVGSGISMAPKPLVREAVVSERKISTAVEKPEYVMSKFILKYFGRYCDRYLPGEKAELTRKAQVIFNDLMKNAPDMGGKDNMMASNMDITAAFFAYYEASNHRIGGEAIQTLIDWLAEDYKWVGTLADINKRAFVPKLYYKTYEKHAKAVKAHKAKGEWMDTWDIEINPEGKDIGIAYHMSNCPLYKFVKQNGYEDMMPYVCKFDYIFEKFLHAKLIRTQTEALGGEYCDYWFVPDKSETAKDYADFVGV